MKPAAFIDLQPQDFPCIIRAFIAGTDELVWEVYMGGPSVLEVPPLARIVGQPVDVEVELEGGAKTRTGPY